MRIMTSNIWGDYFGNEVQVREDQLFEVYMKYTPDVLGVQEVTPNWHKSPLFTNMSGNGYLILNNAPAGVNNFNPMFVKEERFNVVASGFEQLPHTDDTSKNIQWAVLEDRESEKRIAVCNTHFEWRRGPRYDEAREFNAEQIAWRMNYLKDTYRCAASFAFGDMNTRPDSTVFEVYEKRNIQKLADIAPEKPGFCTHHGDPVRGKDGLYHGKTTERPYSFSIDHIVGTKDEYTVADYKIVTDQPALDATDHSPVYADIVI